jgi:predicted glycoside hydrolase/deacetylase ChbG (UPF0249 family)
MVRRTASRRKDVTAVRWLIVNADDFGASVGVNRGIVEAHERGIVTSTSLMVDAPEAQHAARLSRRAPRLSIGLHADITTIAGGQTPGLNDAAAHGRELERQLLRFRELLGRWPTHVDSHHNVHNDPRLLPLFRELAAAIGVPLRGHASARYLPDFYGQWDGETHLEQIGLSSLAALLAERVAEGVTELGCHPGYADAGLESSYRLERETELRTLCDPEIRRRLRADGIQLTTFADLPRTGMDASHD